jgi:hypothetical protein
VRRVSSRTRHPRDRSRHRTGLLCAIYTRSSPHITLFWQTTGRGDQVDRPRGRHHHVPPPA